MVPNRRAPGIELAVTANRLRRRQCLDLDTFASDQAAHAYSMITGLRCTKCLVSAGVTHG
jgi:hypothetical protein